METRWCCRKNSITNWILYKQDFDPGLIPCIGDTCDRWRGGLCISMIRVDKQGRLPVPWELMFEEEYKAACSGEDVH